MKKILFQISIIVECVYNKDMLILIILHLSAKFCGYIFPGKIQGVYELAENFLLLSRQDQNHLNCVEN